MASKNIRIISRAPGKTHPTIRRPRPPPNCAWSETSLQETSLQSWIPQILAFNDTVFLYITPHALFSLKIVFVNLSLLQCGQRTSNDRQTLNFYLEDSFKHPCSYLLSFQLILLLGYGYFPASRRYEEVCGGWPQVQSRWLLLQWKVSCSREPRPNCLSRWWRRIR